MANNSWEDLLPASSTANTSRNALLGQLAASTGGSTTGAGTNTSISGAVLRSGSSDVTDQLSSLANQIASLTSAQEEAVSALQDNTQAVTQNSTSKGSGASSVAGTVEGAASSFLGGGLSSLSPLLGGLLSIFGGGGGQTPAVPQPYMLPLPVQSEAGVTASGQVTPVSYGETGQPRAQSGASPVVTVQVNAMDSQSFLDHSDDIAMAVKQAILNSSSLNDVIADL